MTDKARSYYEYLMSLNAAILIDLRFRVRDERESWLEQLFALRRLPVVGNFTHCSECDRLIVLKALRGVYGGRYVGHPVGCPRYGSPPDVTER